MTRCLNTEPTRERGMDIMSYLREFNRSIDDLPPLRYGALMASIWIAIWLVIGTLLGESFVSAILPALVGGTIFGALNGLGHRAGL